MEFRDLKAEEIEVRVAMAKDNGVSLLLYKDARVDQNILDEEVGSMNWQRHHGRNNANCIVSIWDEDKVMWVEKEDVGTESNTEKEKGLASDSFKRACFNWGIGRELYTAPFIWVYPKECKLLKRDDKGKWSCRDEFSVDEIIIKDKRIVFLAIMNDTTGKRCFEWEYGKKQTPPSEPTPEPPKATEERQPCRTEDVLCRCDVCGDVIKPYIGLDGKEVGIRKHCEGSKLKFCGRVLCLKCINALKEQENAKSN